MSLAPLVVTSAASKPLGGINPFVVGGSILLLLVILVVGLLAFGGGREHT
jgi:hypothetical protein